MSRLPARIGLHWLRQGFALYRKQPGRLTALLFATILISMLLGAVPVIGQMAALVLIPSLSMALMQACAIVARDQRATLSVLATGFRQPVFLALCKLGLFYLAVSLALSALTWLLVDPGFWKQLSAPIDPGMGPQFKMGDLLSVLGISALYCGVLIALCFAAPLTVWKNMGTAKAMFYSFFAVLGAARAFLVMLLAWFGTFVAVGMVVTMILGGSAASRVALMWLALIFTLLLECAIYVAYRQIFEPAAAP